MTVKLLLLKSGEDLIADVQEMVFGEDEEKRVVGYYLTSEVSLGRSWRSRLSAVAGASYSFRYVSFGQG